MTLVSFIGGPYDGETAEESISSRIAPLLAVSGGSYSREEKIWGTQYRWRHHKKPRGRPSSSAVRTTVHASKEAAHALDRYVASSGRSKADVLSAAILSYCGRGNDCYLAHCAGHFGLDVDELRGKGRVSEISRPRLISMAAGYEMRLGSLEAVGLMFRRCHGTVRYALKVANQDEQNRKIKDELKESWAKR